MEEIWNEGVINESELMKGRKIATIEGLSEVDNPEFLMAHIFIKKNVTFTLPPLKIYELHYTVPVQGYLFHLKFFELQSEILLFSL